MVIIATNQRMVLTWRRKIGHRAFFNRVGDIRHRFGAGTGFQHDADQIEAVTKRHQG